jgi:hypothetical protein
MSEYLPYIGMLLTIMMAVAGYFGFIQRADKERADLAERIASLEAHTSADAIERLTRIETRLDLRAVELAVLPQMQRDIQKLTDGQEVFWKVVNKGLGDIIHSPIHVDRDNLVDVLIAGRLNYEEAKILDGLLEEMIEEEKDNPQKRLAGVLLLARTRMVEKSFELEMS